MHEQIKLAPIARVKNERKEIVDGNWDRVISEIALSDKLPSECLRGIEEFSHLEIIFFFHRTQRIVTGSAHPRENPRWPEVGIFAQRKKNRPNRLGVTIVRLLKVEDRKLFVTNLDAVDGTPVLDIKPVFREFLPSEEILQPAWSHELMKNY
ncbi:MAG: SAM-dependent methyltransferase [FCB group bacterium]|nr:SAM-dependent methyltransferase [FCB group bacterium]